MTHLCREDIRADPTPRVVRERFVLPLLILLAASIGGCGSSDDPPVLGANALLASLSIDGAAVLDPEFTPSVTSYSTTVGYQTSSTYVTATVEDANATISVNGVTTTSGGASDSIGLNVGNNSITITVTAENNISQQIYTIAVDRQDPTFQFINTRHLEWIYRDDEHFEGFRLALAADGEILAAGDPTYGHPSDLDEDDLVEPNLSPYSSGAVYVFSPHSGYPRNRRSTVKASNAEENDWFGVSTSLSADGSVLAVGAHAEDSAATGVNGDKSNNDASGAGAVYVYARDNADVWTPEAYIKASNTDAGDRFGIRIALSYDGTTLAVGAGGEDSAAIGVNGDETDNTAPDKGAVYIFTRHSGGVWTQQAYLKASGTGTDFGVFGASVAISQDGDTLAVGGFHDGSEAVYVFTRYGGNTWAQQAVAKASQPDASDFFGLYSIDLSNDGTTLAVGAHYEDSAATGVNGDQSNNDAPESGAVHVFVRDNAGSWTLEAYVKGTISEAGHRFGRYVSLSADGSTLSVGSSGGFYVFTRDSNAAWSQSDYLTSSAAESGPTGFRERFAMSGDGTILALEARVPDIAVGVGEHRAIHFFEL